jgi:hypothetical protein
MRRFRYLNLTDLKLGLDDLLGKRHAAFITSNIGKSYEPMLAAKRAAIDALPAALAGGKPLAEALAATDDEHDGFGGAIWHMTEAYLRLPAPNAIVVDAIKRIRAALIPELAGLRDSYADEAAAAIRRKGELPQIEADLKLIPIAMGGTTLHDWATRFLGAGEKLSVLLSERADATPGGRTGAYKLRSETVALLNRARGAIADECATSKALPSDLDAQIWAYLDELEAQRAEAAARARKPAKPPES